MKVNAFLIATPSSSGPNWDRIRDKKVDLRIMKTKPVLKAREIAFEITVDLPDSLWKRYIPKLTLTVPPEAVLEPDKTIAVEMVSEQVAEAFHLEATKVHDGLIDMLKAQEAKDAEQH